MADPASYESMDIDAREDRYAGALLGLAVGDALGLAVEGMSRAQIERRYGRIAHYRIVEDIGYVSDDTEQTVLLLSCLLDEGDDLERTIRAFRRSLRGWFLRGPLGAGRATLGACLRITVGIHNSGRSSAGNGSAMRAPALALRFPVDAQRRSYFGRAAARVTHVDPRATEGALYTAELTAECLQHGTSVDRQRLVGRAMGVVRDARLKNALQRASAASDDERRYRELPRSGYVVDTLAAATAEFLRHGHDPSLAISEAVNNGGDTDTIAAIVGAWVGALHGAHALPEDWVECLEDGPYGRAHLLALARAAVDRTHSPPLNGFSAWLRNLSLAPLLVFHVVRRRLPVTAASDPTLPSSTEPLSLDRVDTDELDPKVIEEVTQIAREDLERDR
ncbi:MAG: ADP-ribosylglycohydrolase family protein [Myxococcota bacterium]